MRPALAFHTHIMSRSFKGAWAFSGSDVSTSGSRPVKCAASTVAGDMFPKVNALLAVLASTKGQVWWNSASSIS